MFANWPALDVYLLIIEAGAAVIALLGAFALPEFGRTFFERIEKAAGRLARRRALAVLLAGISAPLLRLSLLPLAPVPLPAVHDEFSYLLASDTFASGRLTNPAHPMWVHFETFQVDQQPTYMSMYFPAQGLVMAAGSLLFGHPWFGVVISVGAMCAAICWMLQGWLPPGWALLGAMLAALRLGVFSYWMNSYFGGAVAATGGALFLGALPRMLRTPRARTAFLLASGASILAASRPYEGLLLGIPVLGALIIWLARRPRPRLRTLLPRLAAPVLIPLLVTAAGLAYYDWRLFGDPLTLPYSVNRATYAVAPYFVWQTPRPEPGYRYKVIRDFYVSGELPVFEAARTTRGFIVHVADTSCIVLLFPFGAVLLVPFILFPRVLKDRRIRFLLLAGGVFFAGLLANAFMQPQYVAPAVGLLFALLLQSMRHLRFWRPRGQPVGLCLVRLLPALSIALCLAQMTWKPLDSQAGVPRAKVLRALQRLPGPQLAIVRYAPAHDPAHEWVYNAADIDSAKVVWARDAGPAGNRDLIAYFKNRRTWLVEPDGSPPELLPYVP
jgi:hypothetical protein